MKRSFKRKIIDINGLPGIILPKSMVKSFGITKGTMVDVTYDKINKKIFYQFITEKNISSK